MTGPIAHVGPNLPMDLLRATGRHAGAIAFDPDRSTPVADQWMETKFAPWAKVILEGWAAGEYDELAQVLFSRADDSAQRLYYYVCELQRRGLVGGPEPLILDIAKVPRASSIDHTAHCVRQLTVRLEVDEDVLVTAIETCNAERSVAASAVGRPVCLLAGTPPPDGRLHAAIRQAGFVPVGRTLLETWNQLGSPVDLTTGDACAALARQIHGDPQGPRSFADPGAMLSGALSATGATAVILWQTEEDEAQAWHLPAQRAALSTAGVSALVMTRRDWLGRDAAAHEITAFLGGIKA
ncbi:MAG: hypothetical protein ABIT09_03095 [Croceibacterium sp.]